MPSHQIKLSVDLVEAAKGHLEFLREVESYAHYFRQPHIISNALYRYENYWLPILTKNSHRSTTNFLPPLDVHWVWHTHMLSPLHYRNDCLSFVGTVLDHCFLTSQNNINKARKKTKHMWTELFPLVPFDINFDEVELDTMYPPTKLHISLLGAADHQLDFYYNVSLPHIRRTKFLDKAVKRYEMFLQLKRLNKNQFVVPMYDVDLIWHTHQLCPLAYSKDTIKVLGELLDHTDFTTDPSPPSVINSSIQNTQKLWHEMFHTHLDIPGTGYRGVSTKGQLHIMPEKELEQFKSKAVKEMVLEVYFAPREHLTSVEGKLELDASLITPLKYSYVETNSSVRINLEKNSSGKPSRDLRRNGQIFSWSIRWKDKGSNRLLSPVAPFSISLSSKQQNGSSMTWFGFLDLLSSSPTILSGERGEWTLTAKPILVELPVRLVMLQEGSFQTRSSNPEEDPLWDHVPLPLSGLGQRTYQLADHIIGNDAENTFYVRVVHCMDLKISVIKVYFKDDLVAISHTIGAEQLPSLKQIGKRTFNNLTLNRQHGERAMLIKNNDGDWAIVTGSWTGLKNDSSNGKTKPKEPGNLVIHVFDLQEGTKQRLSALYPIDKQTTRRRTIFVVGDTFVSLSNDKLSMVAGCRNIAEQIALSFSVFALFTLCEPRPTDIPGVDRTVSGTVAAVEARRQVDNIRAGRYSLIRAAGYHANTPSNSYLWWQWFSQRESTTDLPECCKQHGAEIMQCPWLPGVPVDGIDPERMTDLKASIIASASQILENPRHETTSVDEESDRETLEDESDIETLDSASFNDSELEGAGINNHSARGRDLCLSTQL